MGTETNDCRDARMSSLAGRPQDSHRPSRKQVLVILWAAENMPLSVKNDQHIRFSDAHSERLCDKAESTVEEIKIGDHGRK